MKKLIVGALVFLSVYSCKAIAAASGFQYVTVANSLAVGQSTVANAKSVFEGVSTTKGFLIPRMTTTQRDAISSPPTGLLVYNTTTAKLNQYNGSAWEAMTSGSSASASFDSISPMTTLGDTIYGGASGTGTRLAGNTTTTVKFLSQTGDGANSAAPAWAQVGLTTGVTGTLPVANGGTNATTALAALNNISALTTKGDILTHTGSNNVRQGVGSDGQVLTADSSQTNGIKWATPATGSSTVVVGTCEGRLTASTGNPIPTSDVTAATTIYFTPFNGDRIALYDGSNWSLNTFSEVSLSVPATTNTMYDVYAYDSSGLTLEAVAWTNDTTRATAVTTQDGVRVKTGTLTKRYVGSFRTTGSSGETEDSLAKRYVWSQCQRALRPMKVIETTNSWSYTTASFRQANSASGNQLDVVIGFADDIVDIRAVGQATNSVSTDRSVYTGIGLGSTTVNSATLSGGASVSSTAIGASWAEYNAFPSIGRQTFVWLERGDGSDAQTWYGDNGDTVIQSGITGILRN